MAILRNYLEIWIKGSIEDIDTTYTVLIAGPSNRTIDSPHKYGDWVLLSHPNFGDERRVSGDYFVYKIPLEWDTNATSLGWPPFEDATLPLNITPVVPGGMFIKGWAVSPAGNSWLYESSGNVSLGGTFPFPDLNDGSQIVNGYLNFNGSTSSSLSIGGIFRYELSYPTYKLITEVVGGNGTLSVDPAGSFYMAGTEVALTAHPNSGYVVDYWQGTSNDSLTTDENTVMVNANTLVRVAFKLAPREWTLQIIISNGLGTVRTTDSIYALTAINPGSPSVDHTYETDGNETEYIWPIVIEPTQDWNVKSIAGVELIMFVGTSSSSYRAILRTPGETRIVTVEFDHDPFTLITTSSAGGEIDPDLPLGAPREAGSVVVLTASPSSNYKVDSWSGTDDDASLSVVNTVTMDDNKTIHITFVEKDKYTLTASVVGNPDWGWVSPITHEGYEGTTVTLLSGPIAGYRVKKWTGTDDDSIINFINYVLLNRNRTVTVEFEIGEAQDWGSTLLDNAIFYCSSDSVDSNLISIDYTNDTGSDRRLHFRSSFYNNDYRDTLLYSAFSLYDTKRWFLNDGTMSPIAADGVFVERDETVNIIYVPDLLPQSMQESQLSYQVNANNYSERSLMCGVKYFINLEIYDVHSFATEFFDSMIFSQSCSSVDLNNIEENRDENNWVCSGQGNLDLRVSKTNYQSLFSNIGSNLFGHFRIVWQQRESGQSIHPSGNIIKQSIYGSTWDSENDRLYSSGQGLYDRLYLTQGYRPKLLTDPSENFYITGNILDAIYKYNCAIPTQETGVTNIVTFKDFCYPGYTRALSEQDIKIRVYDEDAVNSLVINQDKVVAVVDKRNIRFDITGVMGAYAIRLRNANDSVWNDWINIDEGLYINTAGANQSEDRTDIDKKYDAYFIDNDRIVVPWELAKINGIKRICCEILTFYGISNAFCIDIFVNMEISEYYIELYLDGELLSKYSGYDVVSEKKDVDNLPIGNRTINGVRVTDIGVKVIFNFEQSYAQGDLKFNVIQQGKNDLYGLSLTPENTIEEIEIIASSLSEIFSLFS
ncbi:hypothetical protein LCGC14_1240830 [marine sediment metagenome]|uniref:Bacterial repeat domain-containing protein n=1 Tax=marine sediment metagenome TaxID=412755 RepID=A0A0F9L9X5_9ZZZZ